MPDPGLRQTINLIAEYYDGHKVGYEGHLGYRKSTDLLKLGKCIDEMVSLGYVNPERTFFFDLGCGDGRVNVLVSYFVKGSIGIEIDSEILAEYGQRRRDIDLKLQKENLVTPPNNIALFHGNSLEAATYVNIFTRTGVRFGDVDLFYTYITLHDLFAEKIARDGKKGALYLVYGFSKVLPRYQGLEVLVQDLASQGIVTLYRKA